MFQQNTEFSEIESNTSLGTTETKCTVIQVRPTFSRKEFNHYTTNEMFENPQEEKPTGHKSFLELPAQSRSPRRDGPNPALSAAKQVHGR